MSYKPTRLSAQAFLIAVMLYVPLAVAQRGVNIGGGSRGSVPPTGVNDTDSLKDFHHIMAVQATSQQVAEFQALTRSTEAAKAELKTLIRLEASKPDAVSVIATLDQTLDAARTGNKQFVEGFSANQKAGLRDLIRRLEKADSEIEQSQKRLDQSHVNNISGPDTASRAENLDRTLAEFSDAQLALGREMSIMLVTGQDLSFSLPSTENPVNLDNRKITVRTSGELTQIATEQGHRVFHLQLTAALADLQQNIGDILQAKLQHSASCSERVSVRRAMLMPSTPASVLALRLHYERWACSGRAGLSMASEIAESDGNVEMRLVPAVENPSTLKLLSEFQKIDVDGMMGDALRSGTLGDEVRENVGESVLAVLRAGADFKASLPTAIQNDVGLESASFEDSGSGNLSILFQGRVQLSGEQVNLLASQLNQTASKAPAAQ